MLEKIKKVFSDIGLTKLIIFAFILFMFILAPISGNSITELLSNIISRFSWNAVLVLSLVPMVHSGCGLNFGLPLGIVAGLLGATLAIEFGFVGISCFLIAILIATPVAILFGLVYGLLLNKIKGGEMMIATYVGFSIVSLFCIAWVALPYKSPKMVYLFSGTGLRSMISIKDNYYEVISSFLRFSIGGITIPTGSLLLFAALAFGVYSFLHTKTGTAMTAVGSNPKYARAAGVNVDRTRTLSVIISSWLAAIGIIIYQEGFGYVQVYNAPFSMTMPAVAAILLGGASVNKASISNVIIGTFMFQAITTTTPAVINSLIALDISDVIRTVVSNGVILFALTRKMEGPKK